MRFWSKILACLTIAVVVLLQTAAPEIGLRAPSLEEIAQ